MDTRQRRKKLFVLLSSAFLFCVGCYIYAVNMTALNGVAWQMAEKNAVAKGGELATLESDYLARKQRITLAYAYQVGFQDARAVIFVPAETVAAVTMR